jgi:excisionase family DNA binding protein
MLREGLECMKNLRKPYVPRVGMDEMLTARELEQILKIDTKTIYRYVQQGLIPYVRIQSRIRFRSGQINEWIRKQSFGTGIIDDRGDL